MPPEVPQLPAGSPGLQQLKRKFGGLEQAFEGQELQKTPGVTKLVQKVKASVRHPGLQYVRSRKRPVRVSGSYIQMQTQNKEWRKVDMAGPGHTGKPRNNLGRELALSFGDAHEALPLLACDQSVEFFRDLLLEWAADPVKREFLISLGATYRHLIEKDWRHPTDEMETEAGALVKDCRQTLFPNTNIHDGDKAKSVKPDEIEKRMMSIARETNRKFPNSCKAWVVIILYWLIDHNASK